MGMRRAAEMQEGRVMTLSLQPITFSEACEFIARYHRHHLPPTGWKFGIAVTMARGGWSCDGGPSSGACA